MNIPPLNSVDQDKPTISISEAIEWERPYHEGIPDVFRDKLPNQPPHPNAPRHGINLKDPNKSINGRLFYSFSTFTTAKPFDGWQQDESYVFSEALR
jgi:hypothetical protein